MSLVLVAGCAQNKAAADKSSGSDQAKVYTCKLASDEPEGTPKYEAQMRFIDRVAELTNNEVKITIYPANQLGSSRELIEAAQIGSIQGVGVPTSTVTGFEPKMAIFDLPFLFPSREIAYQVIESEVGDAVLKTLDKHGLVATTFYGSGWKQFTGNFKIEGPESFKGKKIRVMENPILIAQFQALGASAIPINFGELYNALQQNVVDGQENPIVTCHEMKFYEVQKYFYMTNHVYSGAAISINEDFWKTLPGDYQTILSEEAKTAGLTQIDNNRANVQKCIDKMKNAGVNVVLDLPDQLVTDFKTAAKKVWEQFRDKYDSEAMDYIFKNLAG
jgi:C4-dicarboxylate-binding protein DctP